ncbi:uncharacterized protein LOC129298156 [Prosopis cineraria]|uniref:uncharacterized protein LOC129298156 n=1 Tax=Prosopis cineraria TaxID=364024 RepID=UPI00240F41CF|nr:uncharacterized protein LOC129298156 [Prosopis cineraria]
MHEGRTGCYKLSSSGVGFSETGIINKLLFFLISKGFLLMLAHFGGTQVKALRCGARAELGISFRALKPNRPGQALPARKCVYRECGYYVSWSNSLGSGGKFLRQASNAAVESKAASVSL